MDTIFINSEISKTSEPYRLLLNLPDLKRIENICCFITSYYVLYIEKHTDCILCQIFKIVSIMSLKNMRLLSIIPQ